MLDAKHDLFDGHAVGFLHVATKLANFSEQLLRYRRGAVHHKVGVRNACVDFLDAINRQDIAGRLLGEFVGAVRGTNGNRQCITVGLLDEVCGLIWISQQLLTRHRAFGAVTVLLIAHHGFERTEHAQFGLDRDANGVGKFNDLFGHFDVVFVGSCGLAISLQRAIHHYRGKAGADRCHTDRWRLAMILVHDNRNMRIGFEGSQNLVTQESFAGVLTRPGRGLHDHGRINLAGGLHDGPDLLHVIDVEGRQTIGVFSRMVEQLAHGYEWHGAIL